MLIQGTLDDSNNVVIPNKPLVWVDTGGGGGGGGGEVEVTNWPATQPVSGTVAVSAVTATVNTAITNWPATQPVSIANSVSIAVTGPITNAQLVAVTGTAAQTAITTDAAAAGQTMLAVLRGILAELQAQSVLLNDIKTNTTPTPP
jgi:hypothetical protein